MILLLHTLIEAVVGLLFLFYPAGVPFLPGFADGAGESFLLLQKMYGLAALFLAGLSLYAYLRQRNDTVFFLVTASLSAFHYAMIGVQTFYNPDSRAALLHFLLAIFLTGQFLGRRKVRWQDRAHLN